MFSLTLTTYIRAGRSPTAITSRLNFDRYVGGVGCTLVLSLTLRVLNSRYARDQRSPNPADASHCEYFRWRIGDHLGIGPAADRYGCATTI